MVLLGRFGGGGASTQSRKVCSRAAQPAAVYPADAQQAVVWSADVQGRHRFLWCGVCGGVESQASTLRDRYTKDCGHGRYAGVLLALVGVPDTERSQRRQPHRLLVDHVGRQVVAEGARPTNQLNRRRLDRDYGLGESDATSILGAKAVVLPSDVLYGLAIRALHPRGVNGKGRRKITCIDSG